MAYDPRKWHSYSNSYDQSKDSFNPYDTNIKTEDDSSSNSLTSLSSFYDRPVDSNVSSSENIYLKTNESSGGYDSSEYDPSAPAISKKQNYLQTGHRRDKPDPRKLDYYITALQKFTRPLSLDLKKKLPYDVICQLAHSILDGTVFEITVGLKDIQKINEKNLSDKRKRLLQQQRQRKSEISKRHKKEILDSQSRPHQILVFEKEHTKEMNNFMDECDKELTTLDQKIILELDQLMSDQQATLQRAGLPLFYITNNPEDIRLQMYILEFILKLTNS